MSTGVFLVTSFLLICVLAALEARAWFTDQAHLITLLSKRYAFLRWLIELAFVLGGAWWIAHTS